MLRASMVFLAAVGLSCGGVSLVGLHGSCSEHGCAQGQTCLTYYGVAGPSGPQIRTCEIPCRGDVDCPETTRCVTIFDGPGQVCNLKTSSSP